MAFQEASGGTDVSKGVQRSIQNDFRGFSRTFQGLSGEFKNVSGDLRRFPKSFLGDFGGFKNMLSEAFQGILEGFSVAPRGIKGVCQGRFREFQSSKESHVHS